MNLTNTIVRDSNAKSAKAFYEDPLDDDDASDVAITATRRGLTRLALIAAETGARFQREGLECDPMTWLLAPRRMFDGHTAIEACLDRAACVRALVLHGLSIGMDAEVEDLDELIGGSAEPLAEEEPALRETHAADHFVREALTVQERRDCRRLFTALVFHECGSSTLHAFHASTAEDPAEVRAKLVSRFGPAAHAAEILAGFDPSTMFVETMLSSAVVDMLNHVNANSDGPLALGLDITVEQRFAT